MAKTFIPLLLLTCLLVLPSQVSAQSASLSISPPVVEILLSPGKPMTQTFNLKVQGDDLNFIPELRLVEPADDQGHVKVNPTPLTDNTLPLRITSSPSPLGHPLKTSGGTTSLTLTIEAPASEIPHDIYLALVVNTEHGNAPLSSSSTTPAISSLILVTVSPTGSLPLDLEVADFNPPSLHDSWAPLSLTPSVNNQAPIMIRPEGKYEIISPGGKTIYSLPLYPHLVLGNSTRQLKGMDDNNSPISLIWSPSWSDFGPHRLRLTLSTIGGTQLSQIERVVWILPIRLLLIITLFLIIVLSLYISVSRSRLHKSNIDTE